MWHLYRPYNVLVKRVCMDVASLSTLNVLVKRVWMWHLYRHYSSSEKGMYGCGIFIDLEKGMYGCGIFIDL